jgi:hypothetical protein
MQVALTLGKDISLGMQSLVLGYPLNFYDERNHFPITGTACVATWPWFKLKGKPCFLIDSNLQEGMSGSPVAFSWIDAQNSFIIKFKIHIPRTRSFSIRNIFSIMEHGRGTFGS